LEFDALKTPNFKQPSVDFVVRRPSYKELESSPIPDNFADVADEDLWTRLNNGRVTDLDALQMTPSLPNRAFQSSEASHASAIFFENSTVLQVLNWFIIVLRVETFYMGQYFFFCCSRRKAYGPVFYYTVVFIYIYLIPDP
jgi:hypothetical protein